MAEKVQRSLLMSKVPRVDFGEDDLLYLRLQFSNGYWIRGCDTSHQLYLNASRDRGIYAAVTPGTQGLQDICACLPACA